MNNVSYDERIEELKAQLDAILTAHLNKLREKFSGFFMTTDEILDFKKSVYDGSLFDCHLCKSPDEEIQLLTSRLRSFKSMELAQHYAVMKYIKQARDRAIEGSILTRTSDEVLSIYTNGQSDVEGGLSAEYKDVPMVSWYSLPYEQLSEYNKSSKFYDRAFFELVNGRCGISPLYASTLEQLREETDVYSPEILMCAGYRDVEDLCSEADSWWLQDDVSSSGLLLGSDRELALRRQTRMTMPVWSGREPKGQEKEAFDAVRVAERVFADKNYVVSDVERGIQLAVNPSIYKNGQLSNVKLQKYNVRMGNIHFDDSQDENV